MFCLELTGSLSRTLQELMLSERTLHFTKTQMYWHCKCLASSQDGQYVRNDGVLVETASYGPDIDLSFAGQKQYYDYGPYTRWWLVVEDYSLRSLTYQSDKLIAIQGIASKFAELHRDTLLSGIFCKDLPSGLLWTTGQEFTAEYTGLADVPTWSWASVNGKIIAPSVHKGRACVNVVDANRNNLRLRSAIWSCIHRSIIPNNSELPSRGQHLQVCMSETDAGPFLTTGMLSDVLPCSDLLTEPLYLLPIIVEEWHELRVAGLIVISDRGSSDRFRRVGVFDTDLFLDYRPPRAFNASTAGVQRMCNLAAHEAQRSIITLV